MPTAPSDAKANYFELQVFSQPKQLLTDDIFSRSASFDFSLYADAIQILFVSIDITFFDLVASLLKVLRVV